MLNYILTWSLLIACTSLPAAANQPIPLICEGSWNVTQNSAPANVSPSAGLIDFDQSLLRTPVGDFLIIKVTDTKIHFQEYLENSIAKGSLDRMSGTMTVHWATPKDWANLESGKSGMTPTSFASLNCRPSAKLF